MEAGVWVHGASVWAAFGNCLLMLQVIREMWKSKQVCQEESKTHTTRSMEAITCPCRLPVMTQAPPHNTPAAREQASIAGLLVGEKKAKKKMYLSLCCYSTAVTAYLNIASRSQGFLPTKQSEESSSRNTGHDHGYRKGCWPSLFLGWILIELLDPSPFLPSAAEINK